MNIYSSLEEIELTLAKIRAELQFERDSNAFRAGVRHERERIVALVIHRIEALDNWTPASAAMTRKQELYLLRDALLEVENGNAR